MHRFHLPPDQCRGGELILTDNEAHHALRVLRLRAGDAVIVLDGAGGEYAGHVAGLDKRSVRLSIGSRVTVPPPPCAITLVQAVPKGKIFESIIHRATELGVQRIVPLLTSRVVMQLDDEQRDHKIAHWRATAVEAIKQCGSRWLPRIEPPMTPATFLQRAEAFDLSLIASLQPGSRHPHESFAALHAQNRFPPRTLCMWIGPEGDFSPEEVTLIESAGARPVTLGPLVLRVETAAIYCLSILNYELQSPSPA
jgi:16S rRNA (uracil1498-N3)-methyltransferase